MRAWGVTCVCVGGGGGNRGGFVDMCVYVKAGWGGGWEGVYGCEFGCEEIG